MEVKYTRTHELSGGTFEDGFKEGVRIALTVVDEHLSMARTAHAYLGADLGAVEVLVTVRGDIASIRFHKTEKEGDGHGNES